MTSVLGQTRSNFQTTQRYQAAWREAAADLPAILPTVDKYLKDRSEKGGLHQEYNAFRLLELHYWLQRHKPRTMVELGCGATTLVMSAHADRTGGKLISLEENIKYATELNDYLEGDAGSRVTVHQAKRLIEWQDGFETCRYDFDYLKLPNEIDLLYVDGPNNGTLAGPLPCTDAVRIAGCKRVQCLMFDLRISSVCWFEASPVGNDYRLEYGCGMAHKGEPWYVHGLKHHSYAWRI